MWNLTNYFFCHHDPDVGNFASGFSGFFGTMNNWRNKNCGIQVILSLRNGIVSNWSCGSANCQLSERRKAL